MRAQTSSPPDNGPRNHCVALGVIDDIHIAPCSSTGGGQDRVAAAEVFHPHDETVDRIGNLDESILCPAHDRCRLPALISCGRPLLD